MAASVAARRNPRVQKGQRKTRPFVWHLDADLILTSRSNLEKNCETFSLVRAMGDLTRVRRELVGTRRCARHYVAGSMILISIRMSILGCSLDSLVLVVPSFKLRDDGV